MQPLSNIYSEFTALNTLNIKHAFWPFLDYDFNLIKIGLNAYNFFYSSLTMFLFYLLESY